MYLGRLASNEVAGWGPLVGWLGGFQGQTGHKVQLVRMLVSHKNDAGHVSPCSQLARRVKALKIIPLSPKPIQMPAQFCGPVL